MEQSQAGNQQSTDPRDEEKRPGNDSRARKQFVSGRTEVVPPKPLTLRQRWDEYQPSKTAFFWVLVAGVALTMLLGFTWGGWMTNASAQKLATATAKSAVIERLAPICVAQFNLDPERDQKLKVLQEGSSYERTKYVTDQAWATLPGEEKPTSQVAAACADLLMQIGQ